MSTQMALIQATRHDLGWGRTYDTYRWIGKPWWPVVIDPASDMHDLPWTFIEVGRIPFQYLPIYKRTDGWLLFPAWLDVVRIKMLNAWYWVFCRLLMTLMVWGLAYIPLGEPAMWRHIGKRP